MLDFSQFDRRRYRTLPVRDGYREWLPTYEDTVEDEMDLALLEVLDSVPWDGIGRAVDLGCGTGRTGAWLRTKSVPHVDGVDLTSEMIEAARRKGIYDTLVVADVAATALEAGAYDLATTCLVDEHLKDLEPLYRETARLVRGGGHCVLVGYHPHFMMTTGIPAHFDGPSGEPTAVETFVHLTSDHVAAARKSGWALIEMRERLVDERWLALKPKWAAYRDHPVSFAMVWRRC